MHEVSNISEQGWLYIWNNSSQSEPYAIKINKASLMVTIQFLIILKYIHVYYYLFVDLLCKHVDTLTLHSICNFDFVREF